MAIDEVETGGRMPDRSVEASPGPERPRDGRQGRATAPWGRRRCTASPCPHAPGRSMVRPSIFLAVRASAAALVAGLFLGKAPGHTGGLVQRPGVGGASVFGSAGLGVPFGSVPGAAPASGLVAGASASSGLSLGLSSLGAPSRNFSRPG